MKKMKNYLAGICAVALVMLVVSCDNNEEIKVDPDASYDVVLDVNEAGPSNPNKDVVVNASTQSDIKAKVSFTSTSSMKRLYITQNVQGKGDEKFSPVENVDLKGDGSLDLTGKDDKNFEYQFMLPVPAGVAAGTVVYKFWVTSGSGDFRDPLKRLIGTPGTITLKYGAATNPMANVKKYEDKKLFTPTADATSKTFISLLDGQIYSINQGEEYIAFWDFGYINLQNGGPTLHSTFSYPESAITSLSTLTESKNKIYFRASDKSAAEFDAVAVASDLDFITKPTDTFISFLATGDILEFVDQYGKKGMIKVLEAMEGNESSKFIRISIKVQP